MRFFFAALGFFGGFLSACFGIGGGICIVPGLTAAGKFPLKKAVGTSLLVILPVSLSGVIAEALVAPAHLLWGVGLLFSAGAVAGTYGGKWIFEKFSEKTFAAVYSLFLLLIALRLGGVIEFGAASAGGWIEFSWSDPVVWMALVAIGFLGGASSTLFGIGGGVLMVPCFLLLFGGVDFQQARATSLLAIIAASAFGILHHRKMQTIDFSAGFQMIPTAVLGAIAGVLAIQHLSREWFSRLFSLLLILAAWKILRGSLKAH